MGLLKNLAISSRTRGRRSSGVGVSLLMEGFEEFDRLMKTAPADISRKSMGTATAKATTPLAGEMRKRVKAIDPKLGKQIGKKTKKYHKGTVAVSVVGPKKNYKGDDRGIILKNIWHFLELGFGPFTNVPPLESPTPFAPFARRSFKHHPAAPDFRFVGGTHPGMEPLAIGRKSFNKTKGTQERVFGQVIGSEIKKRMAKRK